MSLAAYWSRCRGRLSVWLAEWTPGPKRTRLYESEADERTSPFRDLSDGAAVATVTCRSCGERLDLESYRYRRVSRRDIRAALASPEDSPGRQVAQLRRPPASGGWAVAVDSRSWGW